MQNQINQKNQVFKSRALSNRAFWLKHLYRWHWISSAACLIGMLLFASTGITLNNSSYIESLPVVAKKTATVPAALLNQIKAEPSNDKAALPKATSDWVSNAIGVELAGVTGEWSDAEVYLSLPRPGGDAWLVIDRASGEVSYERTDRGWVSYFNDLHKGRNTGSAWSWFLDIFSITALVFCITGLFMLNMHAGNRPATWPLVGLGVVVPLVLVVLFIH